MNCQDIEKHILKSLDGRLSPQERQNLQEHLKSCPLCQKREAAYREIFETLKLTAIPDPKPYLWQRLRPRLRERQIFEPWALWRRWCLSAIPVSLMLVAVAAGAIALFIPQNGKELSQSEALLLRNLNPLQETRMILEQEGAENKSMMLIFTSLEERNGQRRYVP